MYRRLNVAAALTAVLYAGVSLAAEPPEPMPVEFFAGPMKFKTARLSPDGKHIAFTYEEGNNEGKMAVATSDLKKITSVYEFGDDFHVTGQFWASNERLVASVYKNTGFLDGRQQFTQTFATGYDGKKRIQLQQGNYAVRVLDSLQTDPKNILTGRYYFQATDGSMKLHRTNILNGKTDFFRGVPAPEENSMIVDVALDSNDDIRIAMELNPGKEDFDDKDDTYRFHYREADGEWQEFKIDPVRNSPNYSAMGFSPDNRKFYFASNYDMAKKDTMGVFEFDFDTAEISVVFRHPDVDVSGPIRGPRGEVLGVTYWPGYPEHHFFDDENPLVQKMRSIEAAFPGQYVQVTSFALDAGQATVKVSSDRNPGELYLYEDGNLKFLAAAKNDADPKRLGMQEAFTMMSRDGVKLYGLITLPPGREDSDLPMVVMPHGGPHGPFDVWGYDPNVQVLASNGYAVLQVNFRGSGGHGVDFQESGYRKWGREMQDDITDATMWAVNEGIANPDRICISGGSYGGYATMQGVVKEPNLYQCAIPIAGVYSLPMMWKRGDSRLNPQASKVWLNEFLGKDKEDLIARSPAYNLDGVKADLFIIHGSEDVRVPLTQAEFLRDQLDDAGKDYQWMVRKEGHGFTDFQNRVDMYTAMLEFLDARIGSGWKPSAGVKTAAN